MCTVMVKARLPLPPTPVAWSRSVRRGSSLPPCGMQPRAPCAGAASHLLLCHPSVCGRLASSVYKMNQAAVKNKGIWRSSLTLPPPLPHQHLKNTLWHQGIVSICPLSFLSYGGGGVRGKGRSVRGGREDRGWRECKQRLVEKRCWGRVVENAGLLLIINVTIVSTTLSKDKFVSQHSTVFCTLYKTNKTAVRYVPNPTGVHITSPVMSDSW